MAATTRPLHTVRMEDVVIESGRLVPDDVRRLLDLLPDWFGNEAAADHYVLESATRPTYTASQDGMVVGILQIVEHFPESAEVHLLAVAPQLHGTRIGSRLLARAESDLVAAGCLQLQVKTLGPSDPDENYARTRGFYRGHGFVPLEERTDIWPDDACLFMVKPLR